MAIWPQFLAMAHRPVSRRPHTRPPFRRRLPPGRASAIDSRAIMRFMAAEPKPTPNRWASASAAASRWPSKPFRAWAGRRPAFEAVQLDFLADGPAATVSFSDATANGESGLADGVLDNVWLVELSPQGTPLTAARSPSADDPQQAELLALLMDADSPTSVTWNDAVDFYLYESTVHDRVMQLRSRLNESLAEFSLSPARAHVLAERPAAYHPRIFLRGDPSRRGPAVPRHFLTALSGDDPKPLAAGTARLDLARAIASATNPLTARVLVNRVWLHHFGAGLVASPSNFGLRGDSPSHPELLDYLAQRFVSEGWSIKQLHRWMMLSSTYQQSSADRPDAVARDPENRLLARMNRQRLDFESLRDAMLATAGRLDLALGGPPVDLAAADCRRRTLYGLVDRQNLSSMLRPFDFASPDAHTPTRHVTTVPQQALFLLNSPLVLEQAAALAERTATAPADAAPAETSPAETAPAEAVQTDEPSPACSAWPWAGSRAARKRDRPARSWLRAVPGPNFAQVMLLSNEFIFVD